MGAKMGPAMTARLSAMTTFLKSPHIARLKPDWMSPQRIVRSRCIWGSRALECMIGPATMWGKNATKSAKSTGSRVGSTSPRYTSTM